MFAPLRPSHPFGIFSGVYERKGEKSTGISRSKWGMRPEPQRVQGCPALDVVQGGMEDKETGSNISLTKIRPF
jgi:hypothetical protein